MSGPYDQDDDDGEVPPRLPDDLSRFGTARVPQPPPGRAATKQIGFGEVSSKPGAPWTPIEGDPRNPENYGCPAIRLDSLGYDPLRHAGTVGGGALPEFAAKGKAEHDATAAAWLPGWVANYCRTTGQDPPAWAYHVFQARGRPDLVAWCSQVAASLAEQRAAAAAAASRR